MYTRWMSMARFWLARLRAGTDAASTAEAAVGCSAAAAASTACVLCMGTDAFYLDAQAGTVDVRHQSQPSEAGLWDGFEPDRLPDPRGRCVEDAARIEDLSTIRPCPTT